MKIYTFVPDHSIGRDILNIHGRRPFLWWVVAHRREHAAAFAEKLGGLYMRVEEDALQVMLTNMDSIDAILDEDGNPLTLAQVQS